MKKYYFLSLVIILAALAFYVRLTPHPANFAPMGAIAIFSGAYLPKRWSWLVPLAILFATDLFLGFYEPLVMLAVYGSMAVSSLAGRLLSKRGNIFSVLSVAVFSSVFFFIVTNFAVWAASGWYPHNLAGLGLNYYLAIPFFRNSFMSDLFFTFGLFGAYQLISRYLLTRQLKLIRETKVI